MITLLINPEKHTLQLTCKNQNAGGFANPAPISVTINGQVEVARITMGYTAATGTYTY
jgi:hypothetical protein